MKKIAIHSVPRSGSSWVGQIFNSSPNVVFRFQPLFSYAFKDYLTPQSSREEIDEFFRKIAESEDDFLLQKDKVEQGIYPVFDKTPTPTHIVYKEVRYHHILENMLRQDPEVKVVGLVRNPFGVIHSFLNAPREFRRDQGWDELEEWRYAKKKNLDRPEEFYGYERWKEVLFLFRRLRKEYPERFFLLDYDVLLERPLSTIERVFDFCEIPFSSSVESFLQRSISRDQNDPYSVFKKKTTDNAWKGRLDPFIVQEIRKDLLQNGLEEFLDR